MELLDGLKFSLAAIRRDLRERDGDNCAECGKQMRFDQAFISKNKQSATIGHRVPKSHDGTYDLENLELQHYECNNKRGDSGCPLCAAGNCPGYARKITRERERPGK
jgi:5-methylcytosine-specific restriction endonuclease McrA